MRHLTVSERCVKQYNTNCIYSWLIPIAGWNRLDLNLFDDNPKQFYLKDFTYILKQVCLEKLVETKNLKQQLLSYLNICNPTCIQFNRTFKNLFVTE